MSNLYLHGSFISSALSNIWRIFTGLNVPVFNISFAQFFLGLFVISLSIGFFKSLFNVSAPKLNKAIHSSDTKNYRKKGKSNA